MMLEVGKEGDQTVEETRSGGGQKGGAARVALGTTRGQSGKTARWWWWSTPALRTVFSINNHDTN